MTDLLVSKPFQSPILSRCALKLHISGKDEYMDILQQPLDSCTCTALGHKICRALLGGVITHTPGSSSAAAMAASLHLFLKLPNI